MATIVRLLLRMLMTGVQRIRVAGWFLTRPQTFGVRAIVLTPAGQVVLVKHRYVGGWHLPSGGRKRQEAPVKAIVRELREEIGLEGGSAPEWIDAFDQRISYRDDHVDVFLVRDARYRPPLSLEIEAVADYDWRELPADTAMTSRRQVEAFFAV
jgi:8-oxo-dGTP pyrophosphatase MutT (NUDIX family)